MKTFNLKFIDIKKIIVYLESDQGEFRARFPERISPWNFSIFYLRRKKMFCPNCGNQIPDGGVCPRCNPIPQAQQAVPPPQFQQAVPPPQFQQAAPPPQFQQAIPPQGLSGAVPPPPPPPPSSLPAGGYNVNNVLNNPKFKLLEKCRMLLCL